jgi:hypothetical protein
MPMRMPRRAPAASASGRLPDVIAREEAREEETRATARRDRPDDEVVTDSRRHYMKMAAAFRGLPGSEF